MGSHSLVRFWRRSRSTLWYLADTPDEAEEDNWRRARVEETSHSGHRQVQSNPEDIAHPTQDKRGDELLRAVTPSCIKNSRLKEEEKTTVIFTREPTEVSHVQVHILKQTDPTFVTVENALKTQCTQELPLELRPKTAIKTGFRWEHNSKKRL